MAYLALLWKARTIEKYRLKYEKEKINSINSDKAELRSTLYQKWTVYHNDSQKKLGKFCRNCLPEGSKRAKCCTYIKENSSFLLKIVIGMTGGILTYCLYKIFVYHESLWTVFSWVVSVAIILGVAFSYKVRCLVLLLVPGLFSRVGRYMLACYALVLILTGPAANTLKNLDTLSASLACGQEQIKFNVKEMKESKDSPLNLVKETISTTVEEFERLATKMKELMVVTHRLTMSIAHVLQSSLSWLNSVETICNHKLGTPYEHCSNILADGARDCHRKFPELSSQWDWGLLVRAVCFNLRPGALCVAGDFAKGSIVATVKKKLQTYSNRIQSLFNMGVHIRRSHTACSNGSVPVSQAAAGIVTDLRNRADTILAWLSWTCALTGLFLMMIIFRAKYYLHMFRTRSRFDNRYITKELRELDLKRQRQGRETVLPLNTRERAKYVSTASFRLLPSEKTYLSRSIVFMVITTLKLMIHMVADYSLYWVLMSVRFHGCDHTHFQRMPLGNHTAKCVVSGSGPLAGTVRMLAEALTAPLSLPATATNCLPNPNPPDLRRYAQIGTLILLLWLLALFEPYGLRLRHVISAHYQPERAKARAVWLYYHIIRTRSCFLKFARRKLHRQYKYTSEEKLTFKRWLQDCVPCSWLRILLRVGPAEPHCLLCYTKHRQSDLARHLKRCETPSCPGVFCTRCFMDIGQLCTICYSPEDYGDLSDVSLEKFTSDDSEGDDSEEDDKKHLMKTRDKEIEQGGICSNNNNKHKRDTNLTTRRKDDNHESMPLLDCDYLIKDYTGQGTTHLKYTNNIQEIITGLEANNDFNNENISDNFPKCKNLSLKVSKLRMFFMDTEVTDGITFPKGKLGAIVRTIMLLLTSRDDKYSKISNFKNGATKYKPFEYLVMEMFQQSVVFQGMIPVTRKKSAIIRPLDSIQEIDESFNSKILHSLSKLKTTEACSNTKLQTDFNFNNTELIMKYIQNDSQNKHKSEKLSKRFKKMRHSRRNAKRFLDLKKTITTTVRQRISNSRISCKKYKFTCNRRKRINQRFKYLTFISTTSKVLRDKLIKYVNFHSLHDTLDLNIEQNKQPITIQKTAKRSNPTQPVTIHHTDQSYQASQKSERTIKNNLQNLDNIAAGDNHSQFADESSGERPRRATDEKNGIETDNKPDHKTMDFQSQSKKSSKLTFWESFRLRRRRKHSQLIFHRKAKDYSLNNITNHKTRKKSQVSEKIKNNNIFNAKSVKDDVQSCRVNFCLNNVEMGGKIAYNNYIMDMDNDEMPLCPDRTKTEIPLERKEIKEICLRLINVEETKRNKIKTPSLGGCQTHKTKDDGTTCKGKLLTLSKKLKSVLSQITWLSKRSKGSRSISSTEVESKNCKSNLDKEPCPYLVESNEGLRIELSDCKTNKLNDENSTEENVCEDSSEPLQDDANDAEVQTECTETESCTEMEPFVQGDSNSDTCVHEWKVKPKTEESNKIIKTKEKTKKTVSSFPCPCCQCAEIAKGMKNTQCAEKMVNTESRGSSTINVKKSNKSLKPKEKTKKTENNTSCPRCQCTENVKRTKTIECAEKKVNTENRDHCSCCQCKGTKSKEKLKKKERWDGNSSQRVSKNKKKSENKMCNTDSIVKFLNDSKKTEQGKASLKLKTKASCSKIKEKLSKKKTKPDKSGDDHHVCNKLSESDSLQNYKNKIVYKAIKKCSSSDTSLQSLDNSNKNQKGNISKQIKEEIAEKLLWASDICNQAVLEYANERQKTKRRSHTSTTNRSTTTLPRIVANVSTGTSDWWSPLLERKTTDKRVRQRFTILKLAESHLNPKTSVQYLGCAEAKGSYHGGKKRARRFLTPEPKARVINMRSEAFFTRDAVLSPSDYLMQSDQYCTQMYSTNMSPSYGAPPRKMQSSSVSVSSPKWWPVMATEDQAYALRHYTRKYRKSKTNWKSRNYKHKKETCEDSITSSRMWTASTFSTSQ